MAGDDRLGVHLLHRHSPVFHAAAGDDLQPVEERRGMTPAIGLDEAGDNVGAAVVAAVAFL